MVVLRTYRLCPLFLFSCLHIITQEPPNAVIGKLGMAVENLRRLADILNEGSSMAEATADVLEALVHAAHTPVRIFHLASLKGCGDHRSYKVVGTCIRTLPLSKDAVTTAPIYIDVG